MLCIHHVKKAQQNLVIENKHIEITEQFDRTREVGSRTCGIKKFCGSNSIVVGRSYQKIYGFPDCPIVD